MTAYHLELNEADVRTIAFVGARYAWSEALLALDVGRNELDEVDAWRIKDAIESDMVGGHSAFPMLDSRSELYRKLDGFWRGIV